MKNNLLKGVWNSPSPYPYHHLLPDFLIFLAYFDFLDSWSCSLPLSLNAVKRKFKAIRSQILEKRNIFSRENVSKPIMLTRYIFLLLHVFSRSCGLDINNGQMLNGHYTLLYAPFPFLWHFCGGADSNSWGCQERLKLMKFWRSDSIICSHVLFLLLLVAIRST